MSLRGSRQQPVIFEVEDLHWVDRTSEEYLAFLVERLAGAAILILCTYRPGYRPSWIDKSYATQIGIRALSSSDSLMVVQSVLEDQSVRDNVAQGIAGDHTPVGCRAGDCLCPATCDGLADESLESDEVEAEVVARVVASLKAAHARQKHLDGERRAREAAGTCSTRKPRLATTRAVAPRTVTTKPKAPAMLPSAADEDGRIHGLLSIEEEALEAIGA